MIHSKTKCSFGRLNHIFQSMEINNRLCNESDESGSADLGNLSDESSDEILSEIETAQNEPMDNVKMTKTKQVHHVSMVTTRLLDLKWMGKEHRRAVMKRLMSKTVETFPDIFKGSRNGDIKKCTRWWENKDNLRQHEHVTRLGRAFLEWQFQKGAMENFRGTTRKLFLEEDK